jgi:hypothetical protein
MNVHPRGSMGHARASAGAGSARGQFRDECPGALGVEPATILLAEQMHELRVARPGSAARVQVLEDGG